MADDALTSGEKLANIVDEMINEQAVLIAGPIAELMKLLERHNKDMQARVGLVVKRLGTIIDRRQEELRMLLRSVAEEAMIKGVY